MPNEDRNTGGSSVLNLRIWWRHVKTLYSFQVSRKIVLHVTLWLKESGWPGSNRKRNCLNTAESGNIATKLQSVIHRTHCIHIETEKLHWRFERRWQTTERNKAVAERMEALMRVNRLFSHLTRASGKVDSHRMLADGLYALDLFCLFSKFSSVHLDYGDTENGTAFRVSCLLWFV